VEKTNKGARRGAAPAGPAAARADELAAGVALQRGGRLAEAEEVYARRLRADANDPDALHLLGLVAHQRGDHGRAIELIGRAIKRGGKGARFHVNLGAALRAAGRPGRAAEHYRAALRLDPRSADAHNNLGNVLQATGDVGAALEHLRLAQELAPGDEAIRSNALYALHFAAGRPAAEVAGAHRAWGARLAGLAAAAGPHANDRSPERRLRVGFVSADLRTHSVAFFFAPLLGALDRAAFEAVCYSAGARADGTTARLRALADGWADVAGEPDERVAERVRADGIDVLVDLGGHTAGNRLGVFARRPAPVQATWLGYPNTTGLAAIDVRITDALVDPAGEADALCAERLARLDRGFLCYEPWPDAPAVAPTPAERAGRVAFGSFNNPAKVGPPVVDLWARVVRAVEGSTLVLKAPAFADAGARALFEARFKARGVAPRRLRLLPEEPTVAGHLARYAEVDVALDPFPYSGTTTTCEALYMGVPVVALAGDRHAARVSAALLARVGLASLVARDADEYVAVAAGLAGDVVALAGRRREARARLLGSPLCDRARFAREFGAALRAAWRRWCEGAAPA
jgi:predicted O-linked N-acetylglucosamine transferase (SPINDLY family)